jgi:DNA-binding NarL/FixJ family response regulator
MSIVYRQADASPASSEAGQVSVPARLLFIVRDRLFAETVGFALRQLGMEVEIASPSAAEQAWRPERPPDLVLIEVEINGAGVELATRFLRWDPSVKVVALLSSLAPTTIDSLSEVGFTGWITKDTPLSTFVHGLRHCLAGRSFRQASRPHRARGRSLTELLADQLTPREREVVAILVEGKGNEEIGVRLRISPNTVRTHIQSVLSKLQLHSRVEIAAWAFRNGLGRSVDRWGSPGPS